MGFAGLDYIENAGPLAYYIESVYGTGYLSRKNTLTEQPIVLHYLLATISCFSTITRGHKQKNMQYMTLSELRKP